jgi:hypothetical protein
METSSKVPAYNGELRPARGPSQGQYRGKSDGNTNRHDPVTTDPFQPMEW